MEEVNVWYDKMDKTRSKYGCVSEKLWLLGTSVPYILDWVEWQDWLKINRN